MPNLNCFVKICVDKDIILKNFIKNNWQILIPELLIIISFITFWGRFGDIVIDSYREVYIPQQILEGKVIYKDLFVIYPPLAYLINAFLNFLPIYMINSRIGFLCGIIPRTVYKK